MKNGSKQVFCKYYVYVQITKKIQSDNYKQKQIFGMRTIYERQ